MKIIKKSYYLLMGAVVSVILTGTMMAFAETAPNGGSKLLTDKLTLASSVTDSRSEELEENTSRNKTNQYSHTIQHCQTVHWVGNRVYTIKGSMNMATHIVLPESAVDVIVGNKDLWNEEHKLNHVFVKPNTTKAEGEVSTLTYIGESNTSYEFVLKRVPDNEAVPCVIINRSGNMMNSASWNSYENRDKQIVQVLATQFEKEKTQIIKQQQNALDKYRGTIYTNYKWKEKGGWFGHNFVSDVYDDGRWTYVRVNSDNKGVMSICGVLDGKNDALQFTYDETTKMYRVSGIYPRLTLAYGNDTVVIDRQSV